jgi:tyrosine-protein phosphatase non-receptor type 4
MSMKLHASSGSYNVRASEAERHRPLLSKTSTCHVHFLDESEATFEVDVRSDDRSSLHVSRIFVFQKRAKAQSLLDKVFEHLELVEKDYFGLQFVDVTSDGLVSDAFGFLRLI